MALTLMYMVRGAHIIVNLAKSPEGWEVCGGYRVGIGLIGGVQGVYIEALKPEYIYRA